jgi:phosphodiesterase/alkaline phosphatase D-like protein
MSIRKLGLTVGLALVMSTSGVFFSGTRALAAQTYGSPSFTFGSLGSGAGQFVLLPAGATYGYEGRSGSSVAVNDVTHDVYVTDTGNARIDEFDQNGNFLRAWGYGVADGSTNALQICTTACFAGIPGSGEGQLTAPVSIAVDNSGGSSNEDVYVADTGNDRITKFDSTGAYLATIPVPAREQGSGLMGVAVDVNGKVWLAEDAFGYNAFFDEFESAGALITSWQALTNPHPGLAVDSAENVYADTRPDNGGGIVTKYNSIGESLLFAADCCSDGLAFDSSTGDLFSDHETFIVQSDSSGNVIREFGSGSLSAGQGVAVDPGTGTLYVADSTSNKVVAFSPVALPDAIVGAPSNIQRTSVTLHGTVKPDGIDANGIQFQYGATNSYVTAVAASPSSCSSGETECSVSATITGLTLDTTYHYRLDASNANGTNNSQDTTFTTAPAVSGVSSGSVSGLTATSTTITGSLEPEGLETHYYCQYGLEASYGSTSPASPGTETSASSGVPATCLLSGLEPNKTYHYRLVATNSYGTTDGEDKTFATPSAPPSVDRQLTTVVTQTSASVTALVNPNNEDTTYHFEYGPTTAYGTSLATVDIGSAYGDVNVGVSLIALEPASTYHYRVVATNAVGTTNGTDQTFTTAPPALPAVQAQSASEVSQNGVSLSGTVDPQGVQTLYEFDLGADTSYGTRVFGNAGFGTVPVNVSAGFQDLAAGTTYHYRLVASNIYGTVYGPDQTFATPSYPSATLSAPLTPVLIAVPIVAFPSSKPVASSSARAKQATKKKAKVNAKKRKRRKLRSRKASNRHAGEKGGNR